MADDLGGLKKSLKKQFAFPSLDQLLGGQAAVQPPSPDQADLDRQKEYERIRQQNRQNFGG